MKGSVRRRCSICGSRSLADKYPYPCPNSYPEDHVRAGEAHDSWSWSFVVDVSRPGENRRQISRSGFETKETAEKSLAELMTDSNRGTWVKPDRVSFASHAEGWLARKRNEGLAPSTLSSYRRMLELHALPSIGSVQLQAVATRDLDELYGRLLEHGRVGSDEGLSPRSVRYLHTIVNSVLADAATKGLVVRNVAENASPPSAKAAKAPEADWWTHEQLRTFLEGARDHRLWGLWRVAAMTGMRRGELAGLRWADVDLDGDEHASGRIHVRQQYAPDGSGGFEFRPPKSEAGRRSIDLDPGTVDVLVRWREAQDATLAKLTGGDEVTARRMRPELVFAGDLSDGSPLRPDSGISGTFDRLVKSLDVPMLSIHGLRHTHCCHLVAGGMDLKAVQHRMGHESASFTLDRYGHHMPGQQGPVAAKVARLVDAG